MPRRDKGPANDPNRYEQEPGAIPLRTMNVAPSHGERLIGFVPWGLTAVASDNMTGKSRLLSAISAIPLSVLRPGLFSVSEGETRAAIGFGAAELRIEDRIIGGKTRRTVNREHAKHEGPIEELPDPIELMISGGDHESSASNWRTRLKALLAFRPVAVTEERLLELVGDVLPRPNEDLRDWIINRHGETTFPSLLEAADALGGPRGELNRRALELEKRVDLTGSDHDRQMGAVREKLRAAAQAAGMDPADPAVEQALLDGRHEPQGEARLRDVEARIARLEAGVEARRAEERRREALRACHGGRPPIEPFRDALHTTEAFHAKHRSHLQVLHDDAAAHEVSRREAALQGEVLHRQMRDCRDEVVRRLTAALSLWPNGATAAPMAAQAAIESAAEGMGDLIRLFRTSNEHLGAWHLADNLARRAEERLTAARDHESELLETLKLREADVREAQARLDAWQATANLLALDPDGPADEDLAAMQALLPDAKRAAALAAGGPPYRAARERLEDVRHQREDLAATAKLLREEAVATWDRLGEIISGAIDSDLIRVRGGVIEVHNEDGRWLDVADPERLSAGRLRRAFLDFFLEHCPPKINVIVEDRVMLAIGPAGRGEVSRRAAAKEIRLLFEQPAVYTEPQLLWYGDPEVLEEVA